jgi:hypothetical protein
MHGAMPAVKKFFSKTLHAFSKTLHALKKTFMGFSRSAYGFVICVGDKPLKNPYF